MSDDKRFGQQQPGFGTSQTGNDTDGRSPEYRDGLTVQDESRPAGSTGINQQSASDWNDTSGGTGSTLGGQGQRTTAADSGFEAARSGSTAGSDYADRDRTETDLTTGRDYGTTGDRELGDNTDGLGRDQTDRVTADETGTLISADKVQGTAVYDASGERLGTIDSLMLNKRSGKVAYAVMSFGGFLGIGERYHPLPWDKLTYDVDKGGYNVGSTQDELRAGPTYSRDELDSFGDSGRRSEVDDYYRGMPSALEGGLTRSGGIPQV